MNAGEVSTARTDHTRLVWGGVLIAGGLVWLADLLGAPVRWQVVLPAAICGIGVLVLVLRRGGESLIGLGIVLAVVAVVSPFWPSGSAMSVGERNQVVSIVDDLQPRYALGIGSLTVDLRELDHVDGTIPFSARVGIGELVVIVSDDAEVTGRGRAGIGEVAAPGTAQGGIGPSLAFDLDGTRAVIEVDLSVGLGRIEVRR